MPNPLPAHLDETTRQAIFVIDQRLADHTLSHQEHEDLRIRRQLLIDGVSTTLNERMSALEERVDKLELKFGHKNAPAKKPAKKADDTTLDSLLGE